MDRLVLNYYSEAKKTVLQFKDVSFILTEELFLPFILLYPVFLGLVFLVFPKLVIGVLNVPHNLLEFFKGFYLRFFLLNKLKGKQEDLQKKVYEVLSKNNINSCFQLPKAGMKLSTMQEKQKLFLMRDAEIDFEKVSGVKYTINSEFEKNSKDFLKEFILHNPLHFDLYRGSRQMEAEIISMIGNVLGSPKGGPFGVTTSGGSESNMMAIYTYREWARLTKGIFHPEIIVPSTVHVSILKACKYYGVEAKFVDIDKKTYLLKVSSVKSKITKNTICIVLSAPDYSHGLMDPIEEISKIAVSYDIGLHVDACLGGFLIPFNEKDKIPFGFDQWPGVTSIALDFHKYGLAAKGISSIFYRSKDLRHFQYFANSTWPGGIYVTPTQAGSRSSGPIAGAWFAMVSTGFSGYKSQSEGIMSSVKELETGLRQIKEIELLGEPRICIVAFKSASKYLNIFTLREYLNQKGWKLNGLKNPDALRFAITLLNMKQVKELVAEIKFGVKEIVEGRFKEKGIEGDIFEGMKQLKIESLGDEFLKSVLDASLQV